MSIWIIGAAVAAIVSPQAEPTAADLQLGLAGEWTGALGYRDYQSNELFELPVTSTFQPVGDGLTGIVISRFDDCPSGIVWITGTSLHDPAAGKVTSTTFRKGRSVETSVEDVRIDRYDDPTHWAMVFSWRGTDDEKAADLRVTQTRDGDALMSVKEVRLEGEQAWAFRNQTRLIRVR